MEVLVMRDSKNPVNFEIDCWYCRSTLKFVSSDLKWYESGFNDGYNGFDCPICQKRIKLNREQGY